MSGVVERLVAVVLPGAGSLREEGAGHLGALEPGTTARIERVALDDRDEAELIRAMGIAEGREVRVLRRAPFGGPLHVRVGEAEFAVDRHLARAITVRLSPARVEGP